MGRKLADDLESPVRDRGGSSPQRRSGFRKSPLGRERSPVRNRGLNRDGSPRAGEKHSGRGKSLKHARSRSPVSRSPSPRTRRLVRGRDEMEVKKVMERDRGRRSDKEMIREKSHSPVSSSPPRSRQLMRVRDEREGEKLMARESERNRSRGSDKGVQRERSRSPISRSPSPRTKRLRRTQVERDGDKVVEKEHERNHGKTRGKDAHSPASWSPSPRTKRLRRAQAEKEVAKVTEREHEKNHSRGNDKDTRRERGSAREPGSDRKDRQGIDRDIEYERKDRRLGRDEVNTKSSRTRHELASPLDQPHGSRHRSHSPQSVDGARARHEVANSRGGAGHRNDDDNDDDDDSVAKMKAAEEALESKEKEKPSFELSGKLAAETNRFRGITLLFNEPPEARKPDIRWRLYVFKAGEMLNEPLYIHRQSCYLFGRERRVADIPTDHPSCSKQHAVIQFRQVEKEKPDGTLSKQVRPYLMDLGSTNKTYLNENPIEPQRYYELFEKDAIKFGNSSREYVLLHENSTG